MGVLQNSKGHFSPRQWHPSIPTTLKVFGYVSTTERKFTARGYARRHTPKVPPFLNNLFLTLFIDNRIKNRFVVVMECDIIYEVRSALLNFVDYPFEFGVI